MMFFITSPFFITNNIEYRYKGNTMGSFNSTCALTRNQIKPEEPVILFPIYCGINKNNNFPDLSNGWKFCLNESNEPMPLYGRYDDYGLFNLSELSNFASLGLSRIDVLEGNKSSTSQPNDFKGGKYTQQFLNFLKSNLLPTECGNNQYNDNEIKPEIFIQEVEQFFKVSNEQNNHFNNQKGDFKVHGNEIFRFEYFIIKHPENPSVTEIANLRFCAMSYLMIAKVLNLPVHNPDECEYDYHQIQLELERIDENGLSGFDRCIQYFINNVPVLKPALSSGEQEVFDLQKLLSKLDNNDVAKLFQEKTKESKTCSLTLLPINKGDTFYMIPIQYELKQYGDNPYVYPSYLNFYDPFMRLFYDDRFSLDTLVTKMIKCQLSENGSVQIDDDSIISKNPMLNIIKYHDYPYFMPAKSVSYRYEIRCGISQGVVYDCLLISESAIRLLINEFETVSKLDLGNDGKAVDYELMLQFPILKHIQSSKVTFNTIYQNLHWHLAILDGLQKSSKVTYSSYGYEVDSVTSKNRPTEIDIKYVLDCFKQQDNMDVVQKFLKLSVLLQTLFMAADSMMFTYLDMYGEARCSSNNSKINPNLEQFWLDLYSEVM